MDPPLRRWSRGTAHRGRSRFRREGQHGRIRHGKLHGILRISPHVQPLGFRQGPRRQLRRKRRSRGGRICSPRPRERHRGVHPPACLLLRPLRAQTHLRPCEQVGLGGLCLVPRPDRALRPYRGGPRTPALGHRRSRCQGRYVQPQGAPGLHGPSRRRFPPGKENRRGEGAGCHAVLRGPRGAPGS